MKKRFMPDDLRHIEYLSSPAVDALGNWISFVKTVADSDTREMIPHIYKIDLNTKELTVAVEFGEGEKTPLYSPKSTALAYMRKKSGVFQIFLRDKDGDKQISSLRHGVTDYQWSDDGKNIVFGARLWQEEIESDVWSKEMTYDERVAWQEEREWMPIEIEVLDYKHDSFFGMRDGSIGCIGIINVENGAAELLKTNGMQCLYPSVSKDGKQVAFLGKPYKRGKASVAEIFVYDLTSGAYRQITHDNKLSINPLQSPLFSNDSGYIYINGFQKVQESGSVEVIYRIDVQTKEAESLMDKIQGFNPGINNSPSGRTIYGDESPYFILDDENNSIYFRSAYEGWENLYRMDLNNDDAIEPVIINSRNVQAFCKPVKDKLLYIGGDLSTIAELNVMDVKDGTIIKLTENNKWLNNYELGKTESFYIDSTDKQVKLQGWMTLPPNYDKESKERLPIVLYIHGGPEITFVSDFWHEAQAIAAKDMICVYMNPRGSSGYGAQFMAEKWAFGQEAMDDLLAAVDYVDKLGIGNKDRVGVTGGSYGGYMTNKLIMNYSCFKAAATQRTLVNRSTSYGTGDIGFVSNYAEDLSKVKMLDVLTERARKSLLKDVDKIETPLLLLHGYKDYRCSFEQSEQLFVALKERRNDFPARLVMFPNENHEITRKGYLNSQIRHLDEIIKWFEKYLMKEGDKNE